MCADLMEVLILGLPMLPSVAQCHLLRKQGNCKHVVLKRKKDYKTSMMVFGASLTNWCFGNICLTVNKYGFLHRKYTNKHFYHVTKHLGLASEQQLQ